MSPFSVNHSISFYILHFSIQYHTTLTGATTRLILLVVLCEIFPQTCLCAARGDRGGLLGVAGGDGGEAIAMVQQLGVGEAITYTQHCAPNH